MPALVLRKHRNAICYIFAEYTFDWPSNVPVRRPERHTRVSGTGFLVSSDQIASNRHVLQPWFEDTDDQEAIRMGAKPRLEKLVAFFPGMMDSLRLTDVHVARDQDLAVARLADGPLPNIIGPLPLAESPGGLGGARVVLLNGNHHIYAKKLGGMSNVLFDIAMVESVGGVAKLAEAVSPSRVVFGSHAPLFYFESASLKMKEAGFAEAQAHAIREGNARKLLPA